MPQRRDNARVQVLAHRNSCCRSVELSRLHYHTARLICNCIVYTYFHKVPDLLSGFRVNGIAVFATNFRISIALQIICVANCDAIPVKLLPVDVSERHQRLNISSVLRPEQALMPTNIQPMTRNSLRSWFFTYPAL